MPGRTLRSILALVMASLTAMPSAAQNRDSQLLLDKLVHGHGGVAALRAIRSLEYDSAGYFIGRYQSRTTHPPYDRLPVRSFVAIDYQAKRGVSDSVSTWPGELNMGTRTILAGSQSLTANTISRLFSQGAMQSFASLRSNVALTLTPMLVLRMLDNPEDVQAGPRTQFRNVLYNTLRYRGYTVYVHPATQRIDAVESEGGAMADHTVDEDKTVLVTRTYGGYVQADGVWFPTRSFRYVDGVATHDRAVYHLSINTPIDPYLALPPGFERANTAGYGGEGWDVSARKVGKGLYLTGSGETHVLYVEMDNYFVVLEPGGFPSHAAQSFEAMKPFMKGKPIRYIVPLHHHDDHAWAVHFYARHGAVILTTPDKEGFLRKLLGRTWDDQGPVANPAFEFFTGLRRTFTDRFNTFDLWVWPQSPHAENMIIGYHRQSASLFTGDLYLGWGVPEGSSVRQGATYAARQLANWLRQRIDSGDMAPIETYLTVHGRPYSREDMTRMLATERTIVTLPGNQVWKTADWPARYGLHDDTAQNPRRPLFFHGTEEAPARVDYRQSELEDRRRNLAPRE